MSEPIILGGCGSSGTTLLRKMLNAHPNIACGPEMSIFDRPKIYEVNLSWLYTMYRSLDFDALDENMMFPLRLQPTNFTYCGLHPDNHGRFYHEPDQVVAMFDRVETIGEFFNVYFSEYALNQGKHRWAEKTPNNIFCIDQIFKWYPKAHFIVLIRDGRDVVLSLTARRNVHSIVAIFRWLISTAAYTDLIKRNPGYLNRVLRIDYEDLVLDTEKTLRKICMRVGEPFAPEMLEYHKIKLPEDKPADGEGKKNPVDDFATGPVFSDSIGKWKKEDLNPAVKRMMQLTMTETLKTLGHENWQK